MPYTTLTELYDHLKMMEKHFIKFSTLSFKPNKFLRNLGIKGKFSNLIKDMCQELVAKIINGETTELFPLE